MARVTGVRREFTLGKRALRRLPHAWATCIVTDCGESGIFYFGPSRTQEGANPMTDTTTPRRALLSVSDKTGLIPFAQGLHQLGFEIISTGGTATALANAGIPVTGISDITGFPEMLEGRVKTLHPAVHGGILADRAKPEHLAAIAAQGIRAIDLVCVNLYPFAATVARPGVSLEEAIENIDIGGPAMIRSAAKNHTSVIVIVHPADYPALLEEMDLRQGDISPETRRRLAAKAFAHTAQYDATISQWLNR